MVADQKTNKHSVANDTEQKIERLDAKENLVEADEPRAEKFADVGEIVSQKNVSHGKEQKHDARRYENPEEGQTCAGNGIKPEPQQIKIANHKSNCCESLILFSLGLMPGPLLHS